MGGAGRSGSLFQRGCENGGHSGASEVVERNSVFGSRQAGAKLCDARFEETGSTRKVRFAVFCFDEHKGIPKLSARIGCGLFPVFQHPLKEFFFFAE